MIVGSISILPEPGLEFRYGQQTLDPHAGLALFGPYDADAASHPRSIAYGLVGTPEGISRFTEFAAAVGKPVVSQEYGDPDNKRKSHLLWPPFPGVEATFASAWRSDPAWSHELDRGRLLEANKQPGAHQRVYDVVNFYLEALRIADARDEAFSVIICVVPDEVHENCRPRSVVASGAGGRAKGRRRPSPVQQPDATRDRDSEEYELSIDFRRQLKARAMEFKTPIQIVRESTLALSSDPDDTRGLTVLSDRAWNLSTTIYYKAGGKPWRLATARDGVCYVGIAFRRTETDTDQRTACCAAQMFLDTGDGVVFRGEFGPWYSPETEQYHLDAEAASGLLEGVLDAYRQQGGVALREIFLHSRSTLNRTEFEGYRRACPEGVKVVGVRVRPDREGLRLYRLGKWPVMRGTFWKLSERTAYLWASGFKPTVLSYDGWEVPVPLRIDIEHGEADIEQVARDVLGLTKLNYNTCKLGDASPVTVGFSDAVGEILVSNPTISRRRPNFKFYI
jgi:hypothetical protein